MATKHGRTAAVVCWLGVAATLGLASHALAGDKCENVNGNRMVVAEARYATLAGTDAAYANAYWDQGDELRLYGIIGGANSAATNLRFYGFGHHEDATTLDCTTVTFGLELQRSNSHIVDENCPSGYTSSTQTLVIDSCVGGSNSHMVYAGKLFGESGLAYKRYWKSLVTVDGQESDADDNGCFLVFNQDDCSLVNY